MSNISVECCMSTISIHASCQLPISTCMSNTGNRRTCNQSCLMFMLLDIPYSFVCVMCVSYVPNDHEKHWMEAGNNVSNVRLAKLYLVVSSANAASSIGLYLSIVVTSKQCCLTCEKIKETNCQLSSMIIPWAKKRLLTTN